MKLLHVEKIIANDRVRLVGLVQVDSLDQEIEIYFEYPQRFADFVTESADAFVPALLLPAMEKGENLEIKPLMSAKLFRNLPTIQDIFHQWYPSQLKKVLVTAESPTNYDQKSLSKVGAFFSLGVDSFYTFIKHTKTPSDFGIPLSHLIYMKGIERPLRIYKHGQEKKVISRIMEVAHAASIDCIVGETNIRNHFNLQWGPYYHGAGLASVSLSLSAGLESVLIPSTDSYKDVFPWGTSPLLDHLWSTEKTNIVHDGSETQRVEKIANFLAKDPLAMKTLRVCTNNEGGETNCGTCPKCVRTMLPLLISGNLEKAITFPDKLPSNWNRILQIQDTHDLSHAVAILKLAKEVKAEEKIVKALESKIENGKAYLFCQGKTIAEVVGSILHVYFIKKPFDLVKQPIKDILNSLNLYSANQG
ncbi:MAG: hypothetical protein F6K50_01810 [Moorea sp. SIO3I7]|uniref:hypothetical protein n=1 Tax=Moorena sp. SIO3I8 TaxID=2607833 RepID=UPI0013C227FA|nr:hypothetical protein [Moorena sp. SIO3I8]NEN94311.1 hypothetical protein [Moorena sp. SIO3I7]NEO05896.1 hypothetical protein [Moorena sp. SIO3I8]